MLEPEKSFEEQLVPLSLASAVWDRVFTIAPLVVIGTREANGDYNLAPKHMVTPLSWTNYFGFVCTPQHETYHNIKREGVFTVSYLRPTQTVLASLTASPREDDGSKPGLAALPTWPAKIVDALFVEDAYLFLECETDRIVDGFDINSLIAGRIVAAYAASDSLRQEGQDGDDPLAQTPLLGYINWGRFARVDTSYAFPFMSEPKR